MGGIRIIDSSGENRYTSFFSGYTIEQLVESYNGDQLKPPTANPARMQFLSALREAFLNTDFDTSSFISQHGMSMSFQIAIENDKIIQVK
jgi:hypothetical protein